MTAEYDKQGAAHGETSAPPNDASRVVYTPRPEVTPEAEVRVLTLAYKYILECAEREEDVGSHSDDKEARRE